jgi:hypothetical protein
MQIDRGKGGNRKMKSLEDVCEEVLNNKKEFSENPMLVLEQLFSNLNDSWHYRYIYEEGNFVEFDNVYEIRYRLRLLATYSILWMDKLEKEIEKKCLSLE